LRIAHSIARMLALQMACAFVENPEVSPVEIKRGQINGKALGYLYGFVDAALRNQGHDIADVPIGIPILYQVLRELFPDHECSYMEFFVSHDRDKTVVMGMMEGGQQFIDYIANPNPKGSPMGFARFIYDGRGECEPNKNSEDSVPIAIQNDVKSVQSTTRLPDLGKHLALKGQPQKQMVIYPSFTITEIAVVGLGCYCTTKVQEIEGVSYCGNFDFGDDVLGRIMAKATRRTKDVVIGSLTQDPESVRQIRLPHPINIGIGAVLGNPQQGIEETFIPLVITDVF